MSRPQAGRLAWARDFKGCYDLIRDRLILMDRTKGDKLTEGIALQRA